jgi:hypothetical protein
MRKLLFSIFCAILFLFSPKSLFAAGEFTTDTSISYDVSPDGKTTVTHTITVENVFTDVYATSYSLNLHALKPQNVDAFEGNKKLTTDVQQGIDKTTISVHFDNALVGRGQRRTFNIRYTDDRIVTRTGEVWEAFIPRLSDPNSFNSYTVKLFIPQSACLCRSTAIRKNTSRHSKCLYISKRSTCSICYQSRIWKIPGVFNGLDLSPGKSTKQAGLY